MRLVIGYRGHERRLFARGPNWWQITVRWFGLPGLALIHWWKLKR